MGTPYESETIITVPSGGAANIFAIKYPGRCNISRIAVVKIGGGSFTASFFSRAFTGPVTYLRMISVDSTGAYTQLYFTSPFAVKIGDVITVSGSPVSGYNTQHRVTQIIDGKTIVTGQAYTADAVPTSATGLSAQITIPTAEQILYTFATMTGASGSAVITPAMDYMNLDPLLNGNNGINRVLYVQFSAVDTYKLVIRCDTASPLVS